MIERTIKLNTRSISTEAAPPEWGASGIQPSPIVSRLQRPPTRGDPRLNREGGTDSTGGATSDLGSADLSNLQTAIDTLNSQMSSVLSRLSGASGTLSATCSGGGVTGTITITI